MNQFSSNYPVLFWVFMFTQVYPPVFILTYKFYKWRDSAKSRMVKKLLIPFVILFTLIDIAVNQTLFSLLFWQMPNNHSSNPYYLENLSDRIYLNMNSIKLFGTWRYKLAYFVSRQISRIDPYHLDRDVLF